MSDHDAEDHEAENTGQGQFSSPPCSMHELDPENGGLLPDPAQVRDVAIWRKAERERLIAARLALPAAEREAVGHRIVRDINTLLEVSPDTIVGVYWPFRGEPDLRGWMRDLCANGCRVALPVVIAKARPLQYREWKPGAAMERGVLNIPIPADGDVVTPNVVIAPLVGFDRNGFRLGYGGGFFDRTLAAISPRPTVIGVGHASGSIPTIYPQWHDIPMSWIVTGDAPPSRTVVV